MSAPFKYYFSNEHPNEMRYSNNVQKTSKSV